MLEQIHLQSRTPLPENLFRSSLDHSVLPVIWFKKSADIIYANQAAADYLEYPLDELLGLKLFDINPVLTPTNWEMVCEKIQTDNASTVKTIHRTATGRNLEVEIRRNRLLFEGEYIFQLNIVSIGASSFVEIMSEFEVVFEVFADYILKLDKNDKITLAKAGKGAPIYGKTQLLLGKHISELIPADSNKTLEETLDKTRRERQIQTVEFCADHEAQRWYEARLIPLENGEVLTYSRNISVQKKTEYQLRMAMTEIQRKEHIYRTLAQNIPNGFVFMFDKDMRYTLIEGETLKTLSYFDQIKEGKTPAETFSEAIQEYIIPIYKQVLDGASVTFELKGNTTGKYFLISMTPVMGENGTIEGGIALGFDIDKLKQTEQELQQRIDQLAALNTRLGVEVKERLSMEKELKLFAEELIRKNQELEQFAYVASHDLQEPLRMVSSYTQLLAHRYQGKLDKDADEFIQFAIEGASRMQSLIQGLLNYSRIRRINVLYGDVDINELLDACCKNLEISIHENDAQIIYERMPEVQGDKTQLLQLFQNLISNAIKFRSNERTPVIRVSCTENPGHWQFSVSDNGIGIDWQHRERIFQIFQRLHDRNTYPGTGIGLAICKKIAAQHGGSIWLEQAMGVGATFCFSISKKPMEYKGEKETPIIALNA